MFMAGAQLLTNNVTRNVKELLCVPFQTLSVLTILNVFLLTANGNDSAQLNLNSNVTFPCI